LVDAFIQRKREKLSSKPKPIPESAMGKSGIPTIPVKLTSDEPLTVSIDKTDSFNFEFTSGPEVPPSPDWGFP
jgi:hypothetical protein